MDFFVFRLEDDGQSMAIPKNRVISMREVFDDVDGGWYFSYTAIDWIGTSEKLEHLVSPDRVKEIIG